MQPISLRSTLNDIEAYPGDNHYEYELKVIIFPLMIKQRIIN